MTISRAPRTLTLPQEIVNLIVDEVAQLHSTTEGRATLRTCCLVSRPFAAQAKKHLWSNFEFIVDASSKKHASRLVRMLRHRDASAITSSLVSSVRSINILYTWNSPDSILLGGADNQPPTLFGSIKNYFNPEYGLADVLQRLDHPRLEHLRIASTGPPGIYIDWRWRQLAIEPILLRMLRRNTLKSITLANGGHFSFKVIEAAFFSTSMESITIRNVTYMYDHIPHQERETYRTLAKLKRLEIRYQHISSILSKIYSLVSPPSSNSPLLNSALNSHSMFPYLNTLVVSMPHDFSMMGYLSIFLSGVASTLEALELGDYHEALPNIAKRFPLSLCRLVNLRRFKYSMSCSEEPHRIESALLTFLQLLTSPTITPQLNTIELRFLCTTDTLFVKGNSLKRWRESPSWTSIDERLTCAQDFPGLSLLILSLELRHNPHDRFRTYAVSYEEMKAAAELMVPTLMLTPSVEIVLEGLMYFYSADELYGTSLHSSI